MIAQRVALIAFVSWPTIASTQCLLNTSGVVSKAVGDCFYGTCLKVAHVVGWTGQSAAKVTHGSFAAASRLVGLFKHPLFSPSASVPSDKRGNNGSNNSTNQQTSPPPKKGQAGAKTAPRQRSAQGAPTSISEIVRETWDAIRKDWSETWSKIQEDWNGKSSARSALNNPPSQVSPGWKSKLGNGYSSE